tara:strand:- start:111 stop:386 length:276 start_codon:yes stop_codon:yes gene_type:complete
MTIYRHTVDFDSQQDLDHFYHMIEDWVCTGITGYGTNRADIKIWAEEQIDPSKKPQEGSCFLFDKSRKKREGAIGRNYGRYDNTVESRWNK